MRRLVRSAAAAAVLCLAGGQALAADPAGDWRGLLQTRNGRVDIAIQVRTALRGYRATYQDMTHDVWRIPLTPVPGPAPAFRLDSRAGTFVFSWNRAAGDWRGVWRERTGVYAMTLERGAIPPAPLLTRADKAILAAMGGLMLIEAAAIARLLQLRLRWRRLRRLGAASA